MARPGPTCGSSARLLDSRAVRIRWLAVALLLSFANACSSSGPAEKPAKKSSAAEAPFPPHGPIDLHYRAGGAEGTLYQLQIRYEGRSEVTLEKEFSRDPDVADELLQMELDYRQIPVAAPGPDEFASSLVLDALRRRLRANPPGQEHSLELGDDRMRTQVGEKVDVDLRGAQPKGDMTPRAVLNRPFALLMNDARGNPKAVTLRGIPTAKRLLASLPIRESIGWIQVAYPDHPVAPGETWTGKRFFANPIGRLGVGVDIEYRLVAFEKIDDVPCARVSLAAKKDQEKAPSEFGFTFDQLRFEVSGDAWIRLEDGQVEMMRLEDIAAVSYRRTTGSNPSSIRMRYDGRSSLKRLDGATTSKMAWADGTKRFVEVKGAGPNKLLKGGPQ